MLELFDKITKDKDIGALIQRIERASENYIPGTVMVVGFDKTDPTRQGTPQIYTNSTEYKIKFTKQEREKFNGKIAVHEFGKDKYFILTTIPDQETIVLTGYWVITGYGPKGEQIKALFQTEKEMQQRKKEVLTQIKGQAVIHKYGTQAYAIIDC